MALSPTGILPSAPTTNITMTIASPCVITWAGHNLWPGAPIILNTNGALPTGLSTLTVYYVISAGFATGSFEVAATIGGAAINTSGSQSGTHSGVAVAELLAPGQNTMANSTGMAIASDQSANAFQVAVNPTITASSYTAGFVMGGIMTFASVLPANFVGKLMSINLLFKGSIQPGPYDLILFNTSPSNGTYTNHAAPTWNASDMAFMLADYTLDNPKSALGTMSVYTIDNIGKIIVGASTSLYAVLIQTNTSVNNPASTTDMSLILGVSAWGL